jgi:DNA-binding CsgD family transcriptional regulator
MWSGVMLRVWSSGLGLVATIAALKTYLVVTFGMAGRADLAVIAGLFMLFFGLTGAVAYLSFTQVRAFLEKQRKDKLTPGAGEPLAKESVILTYAPDWGLSQSEADVAIFVAKGFSNGEIADMRGCAIATVKSQLSCIYRKSGLESRYQLIAFVTDEVCTLANEPQQAQGQIRTRSVLPLVGRTKSAA